MMRARRKGGGTQSGMVLFISLVLLLVLTVAGVSAVQISSLEERMARNARDRMLAFQAAESALREAEHALEQLADVASLPRVAALGEEEPWRKGWICGHDDAVSLPTFVSAGDRPPCYLIEHLASLARGPEGERLDEPDSGAPALRTEILRITAGGVGGSSEARVLLQSTYGRTFEEDDGAQSSVPRALMGRLSWRELEPR